MLRPQDIHPEDIVICKAQPGIYWEACPPLTGRHEIIGESYTIHGTVITLPRYPPEHSHDDDQPPSYRPTPHAKRKLELRAPYTEAALDSCPRAPALDRAGADYPRPTGAQRLLLGQPARAKSEPRRPPGNYPHQNLTPLAHTLQITAVLAKNARPTLWRHSPRPSALCHQSHQRYPRTLAATTPTGPSSLPRPPQDHNPHHAPLVTLDLRSFSSPSDTTSLTTFHRARFFWFFPWGPIVFRPFLWSHFVKNQPQCPWQLSQCDPSSWNPRTWVVSQGLSRETHRFTACRSLAHQGDAVSKPGITCHGGGRSALAGPRRTSGSTCHAECVEDG